MTIDFRSDNTLAASPEIVEAVARANRGSMTSYGGDEITARLRDRCRDIFESDLEVFPVITGTAGNALALSALAPPSSTIVCHEHAHIVDDENGAVEFFSGAKLRTVAGQHGKLSVIPSRDLRVIPSREDGEESPASREAGDSSPSSRLGMTRIECLSITNATEAGTIYTPDEMRALCERASRVHVDGARFANALAAQHCTPADLSWRAGADVLVLGATKNGGLTADLILVFNRDYVVALAEYWHRAGHRASKTRFLSAQLEAYLTDDLWLRNARHANAAAARLAKGLAGLDTVEILQPVEANIVFARFARPVPGFQFHEWPVFGEGAVRIVTGWSTTEEEVDALIAAASRGAAGS